MRSQNQTYDPSLDHLRAFAALLVVFYHSFQIVASNIAYGRNYVGADWIRWKNPLVTLVAEGHTAVGLFIVLSGYLFTRSALHRGIEYGPFIRNRLLRIYPMYLVLVALACAMYPKAVDWNTLLLTIIPVGISSATPAFQPVSSMFWAVAIEFQFYLIFPFLIRVLNCDGWKPIAGMVGLAIALRFIAALLGANARDVSYWTAIGRIDQFLIGMLLAKALIEHPSIAEKLGRYVLPAVVLLIALVWGFHRAGGWPSMATWKVVWPTMEALAWALVIACYMPAARKIPAMVSKWMARIGEVSYSTYLLHMMIILVICQHRWFIVLNGDANLSAIITCAVVVVPAVLALSSLCYLSVEKPFLQFRTRYTFPTSQRESRPREVDSIT